jgi:hypothetical protein
MVVVTILIPSCIGMLRSSIVTPAPEITRENALLVFELAWS